LATAVQHLPVKEPRLAGEIVRNRQLCASLAQVFVTRGNRFTALVGWTASKATKAPPHHFVRWNDRQLCCLSEDWHQFDSLLTRGWSKSKPLYRIINESC